MPRYVGRKLGLARGALVSVAVGALVVGSCVSCSTPSTSSGDVALGEVSIDAYGDVTAVLDFEAGTARLPLDAVALESPEVYARDFHALWVLIDECMVTNGFPAVSSTVDWSADTGGEDRRFGQWSVSLASTYGPDLPPGGKSPLVDTLELGSDYNAELPSCMDAAKQERAQRTSGEQVPMDRPPGIDRQIISASYEAALSSEAGKNAVARRVECLETQGIVVNPDSGAPSSDYYSDDRTAITTAVAEAECNVETGAVQELFDLMARYQAAYMDQHEALIVELAAQRKELISQLDEIILGQ